MTDLSAEQLTKLGVRAIILRKKAAPVGPLHSYWDFVHDLTALAAGYWRKIDPSSTEQEIYENLMALTNRLVLDEDYEGIRVACSLLALYHGGINHDRSDEDQTVAYDKWLVEYVQRVGLIHDQLVEGSKWFLTLSDEDMGTLLDGEENEADAIMGTGPAFMNDLITEYFEGPC